MPMELRLPLYFKVQGDVTMLVVRDREKWTTHIRNYPEPERVAESIMSNRAVLAEVLLEPV